MFAVIFVVKIHWQNGSFIGQGFPHPQSYGSGYGMIMTNAMVVATEMVSEVVMVVTMTIMAGIITKVAAIVKLMTVVRNI